MVNRITNILIHPKKIIVYINKDKYTITNDSFTNGYFYISKILSEKEIEYIKKESSLYTLYAKAESLLSKKRYSENSLSLKLEKICSNKEYIKEVIDKYKEKGLIDNISLIQDLVDVYNQKNVGELYIKRKLYERGFSIEEITELEFPYDIELNKCKIQLEKINMKYVQIDKIKRYLLSKGFTSNVINNVVKY